MYVLYVAFLFWPSISAEFKATIMVQCSCLRYPYLPTFSTLPNMPTPIGTVKQWHNSIGVKTDLYQIPGMHLFFMQDHKSCYRSHKCIYLWILMPTIVVLINACLVIIKSKFLVPSELTTAE